MRIPIVIVVYSFIFCATTSSIAPLQKRAEEGDVSIYYDCGNNVFSEESIRMTVMRKSLENPSFVNPYRGLLYSADQNYRTIRIPAEVSQTYTEAQYKPGNFYIVIDEADHLVDVITEMSNGHYIKCKRVDRSMQDPPVLGPEEKYSFECAHELFTYETAKLSAGEAMSKMGRRQYPTLYQGNLYDLELGYWIYPILRGNKAHQLSRMPESTYFVVVSPTGGVVDVIVRLINRDFIKCTRTKTMPEATPKDDLRLGYLCGPDFFDINYLKRVSVLAKERSTVNNHKKYPKIYTDASRKGHHWIFPLFPNGRYFIKGSSRTKYFLLMKLSFEVSLVFIRTPHGMQPCEETLRGVEVAPSETDDFVCFIHFFRHHYMKEIAEIACKALGTANRNYPARYIGPAFSIPGPYYTWPILRNKMFTRNPGVFRIVINSECELAGAIVLLDGSFRKCWRKKDNSIPGGESKQEITEIGCKRQKNKE